MSYMKEKMIDEMNNEQRENFGKIFNLVKEVFPFCYLQVVGKFQIVIDNRIILDYQFTRLINILNLEKKLSEREYQIRFDEGKIIIHYKTTS